VLHRPARYGPSRVAREHKSADPRHCREDVATPIENLIYIQNHISDAPLTVLDAAHISNVEQPAAYTDAILGFLAQRR
jgi:pimeloyl-ACP methyl ester carboxylesterase